MIESYPLYWPDGWKRSASRDASNFVYIPFGHSRDKLLREIGRLGGKSIILSTNIPLRGDGLPYANFKPPADAGAAVYFDYKGKPMCFACDKFTAVWENLHAIELTIDAIRGISRWGASDMMERAFRGFLAIAYHGPDWRTVLGFSGMDNGQVSAEMIDDAFRRLAQEHHPDKGGDPDQFHKLTQARDEAKRAIGG